MQPLFPPHLLLMDDAFSARQFANTNSCPDLCAVCRNTSSRNAIGQSVATANGLIHSR